VKASLTRPLPLALTQELYAALYDYHHATTALTQRLAAQEATRVLALVAKQA